MIDPMNYTVVEPVMSARDEFAKAAMQGFTARRFYVGRDEISPEDIAQAAYDIAEAMMKEREKRP